MEKEYNSGIDELLKDSRIEQSLKSWYETNIKNGDSTLLQECQKVGRSDLDTYLKILNDWYNASNNDSSILRNVWRIEQLIELQKALQAHFLKEYGVNGISLCYLVQRFGPPDNRETKIIQKFFKRDEPLKKDEGDNSSNL